MIRSIEFCPVQKIEKAVVVVVVINPLKIFGKSMTFDRKNISTYLFICCIILAISFTISCKNCEQENKMNQLIIFYTEI